MRVALVHHSYGTQWAGPAGLHVRELARALRALGHEPHVLSSHAGLTRRSEEDGVPVTHLARLPEGPLRSRALDSPITHIPALLRELADPERFDAVHAFSPQDAAAAAHGPAPVAFTPVEPPRREVLAERRLRLRFWEAAMRLPIVVPDEELRAVVWRWLAVDASVVAPTDAAGHVRIYRRG